jgi:exopolysaccharide biosynthesis polyprenyl glycosylphosphotransferase
MSATFTNEITTGTHSADATPPTSRPRTKAPFRRWVRWTAFTDFLAMGWAALAALLVRFGWTEVDHGQISYYTVGVIVALAWPAILGVSGAYELRASLFGVEELRRILRGAMVLLALAGVVHIVFRLDLSRGYFLVLLPLAVLLTAVGRWLVKTAVNSDATGLNMHRVVAVGPANDIAKFCADLDRTRTRSQVDVVAYVADDLDPDSPAPSALEHLHRLPDRTAIRNLTDLDVSVDMLVRAGRPGPDEMWSLGQRAHDLGVTVAIAPHRDDATHSVALSYVPLGSTPLLMVENPTLRPSSAMTKTVFDRVVAGLLLVVLSPVFLVIMAVIAVRDGRPVFFRQTRVGRRGEEFACLKFRTMDTDAEDRLVELRDANESDGPLFKIKDDPRVTAAGRFLRKHSLDELPQLVNVLKGQMSIVGPRPPLPSEVEAYDVRTNRRLNVKPGITGLWQTQGRSDLPWDDGIYLDLMYIDHWSPLLDLVIMARTVRTIVRPAGAY